jgi:hypothetical protein
MISPAPPSNLSWNGVLFSHPRSWENFSFRKDWISTMTETSPIQSCFIAAPTGSNLDALLDALQTRKIDVVNSQLVLADFDLQAEIAAQIRDVDLVIGVLTRERRSEWSLFELGQAWALGKRILLFAPPSSKHLPSNLRGFMTVRANLSNRDAIEFALDQLLAAPESTRKPARPPKSKPPLGPAAERYQLEIRAMIASGNGLGLEELVADALRKAGVDILSTAGDRELGADLAIWSDALHAFVGNPLLVEIKSRLPGSRAVSDAAQRLAKHVAAAGGLWGLLLYGAGPEEPTSLPPNIIALPIGSLLARLKNESFDDVVRDLRNRRAHGTAF